MSLQPMAVRPFSTCTGMPGTHTPYSVGSGSGTARACS